MSTPHARNPVTLAMLTVLRTCGLEVGDGIAPAPADGQLAPAKPYLILYELPGRFLTSDAEGDSDGPSYDYQLTAVGERRDQATRALDRARAVVTRPALEAALGAPVAACDISGLGGATGGDQRGGVVTAADTCTVVVFRSA